MPWEEGWEELRPEWTAGGGTLHNAASKTSFTIATDVQSAGTASNPISLGPLSLQGPSLSLADALDYCALLAEKEPARYERAALRWHARFVSEAPGVDSQRRS